MKLPGEIWRFRYTVYTDEIYLYHSLPSNPKEVLLNTA